jgi:hypothetical protein
VVANLTATPLLLSNAPNSMPLFFVSPVPTVTMHAGRDVRSLA